MRRSSRKKNSTKVFIAITVVAAAIFALSNYFLNRSNEVVIAKVNDTKIFKSEIESKLRNVFDGQNQEIKIPEIENLPREVIEILVKEVYLEKELTKEAKKSAVAKSKEIKAKIADIQNKILRQAYIDSLLETEITDQKVNDKYAELSNDIAGKKEFLVSHIVTKTKEEAEKISAELKKSKKSFAELAKKHSIDQESADKGGELGYVLEDNMIKEIAEAVSNLKAGEVSAPIQTKFGWHLVKVLEIRDAKAMPFEAVKDNIRDQLAQDKVNEINSGITKDVKIQILIELKEPEKKAEEQPAPTAENSDAAQVAPATESAEQAKSDSVAEKTAEPAVEQTAESSEKADEEKKPEQTSNEKQKSKHKKHKNHR